MRNPQNQQQNLPNCNSPQPQFFVQSHSSQNSFASYQNHPQNSNSFSSSNKNIIDPSFSNSGNQVQVQPQYQPQFQQKTNQKKQIILGEKDLPLEPNNLPITKPSTEQNHPHQQLHNPSPGTGIPLNSTRDTSNSFPSHSRSIRNSRTR